MKVSAQFLATLGTNPLNAGVAPCGNRVVVLPMLKERTTEGGIVIPDEFAHREDMSQIECLVVAVGNDCWPLMAPWCAEGDMVLIAKYAGYLRKGPDGRDYRIINDKDVVAIVKE
jgi:co-chaperonin GroES (HSP10)